VNLENVVYVVDEVNEVNEVNEEKELNGGHRVFKVVVGRIFIFTPSGGAFALGFGWPYYQYRYFFSNGSRKGFFFLMRTLKSFRNQ
jgi:hypothetical protein